MTLSVNGYGQQTLLYQLMRRNQASTNDPTAGNASPPPATAPASGAAIPATGVTVSPSLADFLNQLGGRSSQNSPTASAASGSAAPQDEPFASAVDAVTDDGVSAAGELLSVLSVYDSNSS